MWEMKAKLEAARGTLRNMARVVEVASESCTWKV